MTADSAGIIDADMRRFLLCASLEDGIEQRLGGRQPVREGLPQRADPIAEFFAITLFYCYSACLERGDGVGFDGQRTLTLEYVGIVGRGQESVTEFGRDPLERTQTDHGGKRNEAMAGQGGGFCRFLKNVCGGWRGRGF